MDESSRKLKTRYIVTIVLGILVAIVIGALIYMMKMKKRDKENENIPESTQLNAINVESNDHQIILDPNYSKSNRKMSLFADMHGRLHGQPDKINPDDELIDHHQNILYNTTREIKRNTFELGDELGCGNFGKVFKGQLTGLYHTNSKTTVAVKSIIVPENENEMDNLLLEHYIQ